MRTSSLSPLTRRRGSALVTVLMVSLGLVMIIASVIGYSLTERRLNYREGMRLEARNAAEAISDYGLAQVRQLMETRSDFSPTRFTSNEGQIVKPSSDFWTGSKVVTSGADAPELLIGLVAPVVSSNVSSTLYYFDPADPNNEYEPLRGRYAFRFDLKIIAKATVTAGNGLGGGPQTCYLTQTLSARASPLFSHAVFYNMDLEVLPGAVMNLVGPVHTNGDLYVRSQGTTTSSSLNFTAQVTTAKGIWAAYQKQYYMQRAGYLDTTNFTSAVTFMATPTPPATTGTVTSLYDSTNKIWRDQAWNTGLTPTSPESATKAAARNSFRVWASQTYKGNLQTSAHGVPTYKPVSDLGYAEGTNNDAHKLIEPAIPATDTANYNAEVESQKYATQCGIQIIVNPSTVTRTGRMPDGTSISIPAGMYRVFTKSGTELILPGQPSFGPNNSVTNPITNPNSPLIAGVVPIVVVKQDQMYDMRRVVSTFTYGVNRSSSNKYAPRLLDIIDVDMAELRSAVAKTVNGATTVTRYLTALPAQGTTTTASNWANNIYNSAATTTTVNLTNANLIYSYYPSSGTISVFPTGTWNGGIYIQSIDADLDIVGSTTPSDHRKDSGVRLIFGRGHVASASDGSGLTIATNDALYVLGNYNADGTIDTSTGATSSARAVDDADETPCSIVCDAFTILSAPYFTASGSGTSTYYAQKTGWNDRLSDHVCDSSSWSSSWATTNPSSSNCVDGKCNDSATYTYDPIYKLSWTASPTVPTTTTPLSSNIIARSTYSTTSRALTANTKFASSSTELSTAIMTGITPSNRYPGYYSGGLHNFPRFLENNSGNGYSQRTIAIRGSMVAMYDSTAATEPWSLRVYDAPNRLWGFSNLFLNGRFPPLTPRVMSYRRVDFTDIDKTTYASMKSSWGL
ncbi:MAG: hypothetical protein JSS11_11130 [Verrucomicrobia bacterium]|nr:hypothetical protein [Verrucomicrobiota bacterium]